MGRVDKLDSSFSRSRSSSMSSLENITSEAVQCLAFVDSYTKRSGWSRENFVKARVKCWGFRANGVNANAVGGDEFRVGVNNFDYTPRSR